MTRLIMMLQSSYQWQSSVYLPELYGVMNRCHLPYRQWCLYAAALSRWLSHVDKRWNESGEEILTKLASKTLVDFNLAPYSTTQLTYAHAALRCLLKDLTKSQTKEVINHHHTAIMGMFIRMITAKRLNCNVHEIDQRRGMHNFIIEEVEAHACDVVRDIVGDPFKISTTVNYTDRPKALAANFYDDNDFSCLPILADALEDDGIGDSDILAHCRSQQDHYRGCWVIDEIIGLPRTTLAGPEFDPMEPELD